MTEFQDFFAQDPRDNDILVEKAFVRPPSYSPESSFSSLYGVITAGDHG